MGYRDYRAPGVDIIIQRQETENRAEVTKFYPVFFGTGLTSRDRTFVKERVTLEDVSLFPSVTFVFNVTNIINQQVFEKTELTLTKLEVWQVDGVTGVESAVLLTKDVDYTIDTPISMIDWEGNASIGITFMGSAVTANDLVYNLTVQAKNTDADFDLRLVNASDRFYSKDIFGPYELEENGVKFFNDIAIAAEIAFRMEVPRFYYLEVPRDYGAEATVADIKLAMDKIYWHNSAYRLVPLSNSAEVVTALKDFIVSTANPIDRRETVGFVNYDPASIADINSITELVNEVGQFSVGVNNSRLNNVFGGRTVEMVIDFKRFVLPIYFLNVAIASLDSTVGMAAPLSTREITVFDKLNGPRFRPRDWNRLAEKGVWIVYQNNEDEPLVIRHQLTTSQSTAPEDQEYSIQKNFDAVTKFLRDRLKPYTGQHNITDDYMIRLDATLTSAIQDLKDMGLARELTIVSPWALRMSTETGTEDKRNLVSKLKLTPVYPSNQLDVYLLV